MKLTIVSSSPREVSTSFVLAQFLHTEIKNKHTEFELNFVDVRDWLPKMDLGQDVYADLDKVPDKLKELGKIMFETEVFLIVSPEYNGSYSYALKKLFDHFPKQKHKYFAIATSSVGALGGMRCSLALQHYVIALFGTLIPQMLITPLVDKKFDSNGVLVDEAFQKSVDVYLNNIKEYTLDKKS